MADIRVRNLSQEAAESCYEAYLKGERPKEGTILVSGPSSSSPATPSK